MLKNILLNMFLKKLDIIIRERGLKKVRADLNGRYKQRGGFIFTAIALAIAGAISAAVSSVGAAAVATGAAISGIITAAAAVPGVTLVASSIAGGLLSTGTSLVVESIVNKK